MSNGNENEVVIVAGASSGIGEAATRRLAQDGAELIIGARRDALGTPETVAISEILMRPTNQATS